MWTNKRPLGGLCCFPRDLQTLPGCIGLEVTGCGPTTSEVVKRELPRDLLFSTRHEQERVSRLYQGRWF